MESLGSIGERLHLIIKAKQLAHLHRVRPGRARGLQKSAGDKIACQPGGAAARRSSPMPVLMRWSSSRRRLGQHTVDDTNAGPIVRAVECSEVNDTDAGPAVLEYKPSSALLRSTARSSQYRMNGIRRHPTTRTAELASERISHEHSRWRRATSPASSTSIAPFWRANLERRRAPAWRAG